MMAAPPFQLDDFRLGGHLDRHLAQFSVRLSGLRVGGVRLVAGRHGGRFLVWPGVRQPDGSWRQLVTLSSDMVAAIRDAASAEWKARTGADRAH
jgi:DNA-binding cell septation regulator SpoVG